MWRRSPPDRLDALASRLHVTTPERARDVLTAAVLCECVGRDGDVRGSFARLKNAFPESLITTNALSVSGDHVRHRYLVADSPDAIYVACAGTRGTQDFMADVSVARTSLTLESESGNGQKLKAQKQKKLAAHAGFANRAKGLCTPVGFLFRKAVTCGKRLVLCGHSLGGAVASLALLNLLLDIDDGGFDDAFSGKHLSAAALVRDGAISCVGYAAPPSGDDAMRQYVMEKGWKDAFMNICAPEDFVPRLLLGSVRGGVIKEEKTEKLDFDARKKRPGWGASFVHVSKIHVLFRNGFVHVMPVHALLDLPEANAGVSSLGLLGTSGGFSGAGKKVKHALAEHTMRAYRSKLLQTVAVSSAENVRSPAVMRIAKYLQWVPGVRRFVSWNTEHAEPRRKPTTPLSAEPAKTIEPQPRPSSAVGVVVVGVGSSVGTGVGTGVGTNPEARSDSNQYRKSVNSKTLPVALRVTVTGADLELATSARAEVGGWPCLAFVETKSSDEKNGRVPNQAANEGTGEKKTTAKEFENSSRITTLVVRIAPPTFHGAELPDHLFPNGGRDASSWKNTALFLRGDFGDAPIAVNVSGTEGVTKRSRL